MKKSTESVYEAMEALKVAIEYFLDSHDTSEEVEWYFKDAIPHLLEGLKRFECLCEEGFSCGCGDRKRLAAWAMDELGTTGTSKGCETNDKSMNKKVIDLYNAVKDAKSRGVNLSMDFSVTCGDHETVDVFFITESRYQVGRIVHFSNEEVDSYGMDPDTLIQRIKNIK